MRKKSIKICISLLKRGINVVMTKVVVVVVVFLDVYERDITKWIKEDNDFLETHNFPAMLEQVRNQPYVTFVKVPGSGKTDTLP